MTLDVAIVFRTSFNDLLVDILGKAFPLPRATIRSWQSFLGFRLTVNAVPGVVSVPKVCLVT